MLELNPELQAIIIGLLTVLVTEGLKALGALVKLDLSGAAAAVTAGVVALVLTTVNALLGFVPPEYHELARGIMAFLIVVLSSFGVHRQLVRFTPSRG